MKFTSLFRIATPSGSTHHTPNSWRRPQILNDNLWRLVSDHRLELSGHPTRADLAMPVYYAVGVGRQPGIYPTWDECSAQVHKHPGAKYKKFNSKAEAQEYIDTWQSSKPSVPISKPPDSIVPNTRTTSPSAYANINSLPDDLKQLVKHGYMFSPKGRLVVYCDGSSLGNGQEGAAAGLGVFWGSTGHAASSNLSERVPGILQTNNRGELLAVIRALEECPFPDLPLEVRTDSQYTIACMTEYLHKWLANGFKLKGSHGVKNADMIKHLIVLLRQRGPYNGVRFKYVAGHSDHAGNDAADRLARMGATMPRLPERKYLVEDKDPTSAMPGTIPFDIETEMLDDQLI
ncbi:hypothetical protein M231_02284 [Tremella mesenterica]|uniref:Ribonuclease H n=1 Tax=Tremella mesenterica TaxID=5217 RepID=A0A4Q1BR63_TREME|nr:hypothetical protein M231_02284 [Tremella mesenterica]